MPITGGNPRRGQQHPAFSQYEIEYANVAMNPGVFLPILSTGSAVTYWPARDHFLLLDNQKSPEPLIHEYRKDKTYLRRIELDGFGDPEDIQWIGGNQFLIAQERNTTPSIDELVIIELPATDIDADVNITNAVRRLQINNLTSVNNKGIEGACIVGNDIYFITEQATTSPAEWNCWKVPNTGSGIVSVAATKVFNLKGLLAGIATDLASITLGPDGNLWMISEEGAVAGGTGRLIRVTLDGRLVEQSTLPKLADGVSFAQAEGIDFFRDTDGVTKLLISGEDATGVDFMILKPPTP